MTERTRFVGRVSTRHPCSSDHVHPHAARCNAADPATPPLEVAVVVLPDHLHAIWRRPGGDADYPDRGSRIKAGFSRRIPKAEAIRASRMAKRERGVWQRRCREHQIRDDADLARHVDDVHFNPVKHGHVDRAAEWPYSSIHRFIREGKVLKTWGTR